MMDKKYEKPTPVYKENMIVLSRNREGQFVLLHTATGETVETDKHTASKLMLLDSLKEFGKSQRLASHVMGCAADGFQLDAVLQEEVDAKEMEMKREAIHGLTENLNVDEWKGKNNPTKQENEQKAGKGNAEMKGKQAVEDNGKNKVLDAHVTGIGAGGDFHLAARVKGERSGEIRDVKGMITGLDAALLRSDTNEQGKDGTILRNAQALASENFEKGMSATLAKNNSFTMKME